MHRGGLADGGSFDSGGAGVRIDDASPELANLVVTGNTAGFGGGIYISGASAPTITNAAFSDNTADSQGGALRSVDSSAVTITNATFSNNAAGRRGGAIYLRDTSAVTITNAAFSGNSAAEVGGGAIEASNESILSVTNTWFSNNTTERNGGALRAEGTVTITNVTFFGNSAAQQGGAIKNDFGEVHIRNAILWDDSAPEGPEVHHQAEVTEITHSIVQGGIPAGMAQEDFVESISEDPLFQEASAGNFHLLPSSPAIDAGNSFLSDLPEMDPDGNPRIVDGDNDDEDVIDMGAFEFQP